MRREPPGSVTHAAAEEDSSCFVASLVCSHTPPVRGGVAGALVLALSGCGGEAAGDGVTSAAGSGNAGTAVEPWDDGPPADLTADEVCVQVMSMDQTGGRHGTEALEWGLSRAPADAEITEVEAFELPQAHRFLPDVYRDLPTLFARARSKTRAAATDGRDDR